MAIYYKAVFSEGDGRKVLNDILVKGKVLSNIYDADSREHAYNEGRRSLALEIMHMLDVDIEAAEKRFQEWSDHDKKYNH